MRRETTGGGSPSRDPGPRPGNAGSRGSEIHAQAFPAQHTPGCQTPCRRACSGQCRASVNNRPHRTQGGGGKLPKPQAPGPVTSQGRLGRACCQRPSAHSAPGLWRIRTPTPASLHVTPRLWETQTASQASDSISHHPPFFLFKYNKGDFNIKK